MKIIEQDQNLEDPPKWDGEVYKIRTDPYTREEMLDNINSFLKSIGVESVG